MGLDMYLMKSNKYMDQSDFIQLGELYNVVRDKERLSHLFQLRERYASVADMAKALFEEKFSAFAKYLEEGRIDEYNMNLFGLDNMDRCQFSDFEDLSSLTRHYTHSVTQALYRARISLEEIEQGYGDLLSLTDGIEQSEVFYWRKHADLNAYLQGLAYSRGLCSDGEDFNGQDLVLTEDDVRDIVDKTSRHLNGEETFETGHGFFWGTSNSDDYRETLEVFLELLETFDFENNTLYYWCSW